MTVADAWSSAETTEAASVDATGTRAAKICDVGDAPAAHVHDLCGDVDVDFGPRRVEFEGANVEIELVVGRGAAAGERPGEPGVLEGLD